MVKERQQERVSPALDKRELDRPQLVPTKPDRRPIQWQKESREGTNPKGAETFSPPSHRPVGIPNGMFRHSTDAGDRNDTDAGDHRRDPGVDTEYRGADSNDGTDRDHGTPAGAAPAGDASPASTGGGNALELYDDNGNGRITCAEAKAHGIAPVHRNHPAYEYMRDGDGDGVVCE